LGTQRGPGRRILGQTAYLQLFGCQVNSRRHEHEGKQIISTAEFAEEISV